MADLGSNERIEVVRDWPGWRVRLVHFDVPPIGPGDRLALAFERTSYDHHFRTLSTVGRFHWRRRSAERELARVTGEERR